MLALNQVSQFYNHKSTSLIWSQNSVQAVYYFFFLVQSLTLLLLVFEFITFCWKKQQINSKLKINILENDFYERNHS